MTTPPVFPSLPGLGWSVTKAPRFATRTQKAVSGRQLRIADQPNPIWSFTLTVPVLRDAHDTRAGAGIGLGIGFDELRSLAGFFLSLQGAFGAFLFDDPSDDTVTGQQLAIGNASQTAFPLARSFGANGFLEPLLAVGTTAAVNIYLNGVRQTSGYTLSSSLGYTGVADTVTFTAAPAGGVAVTADFAKYYFLCHFTADSLTLENFMYQLWQAKEVKFESILP